MISYHFPNRVDLIHGLMALISTRILAIPEKKIVLSQHTSHKFSTPHFILFKDFIPDNSPAVVKTEFVSEEFI